MKYSYWEIEASQARKKKRVKFRISAYDYSAERIAEILSEVYDQFTDIKVTKMS